MMLDKLSRDTKRGLSLLGATIAGFLLLWFLAVFVPLTSEGTAKNIATGTFLSFLGSLFFLVKAGIRRLFDRTGRSVQ